MMILDLWPGPLTSAMARALVSEVVDNKAVSPPGWETDPSQEMTQGSRLQWKEWSLPPPSAPPGKTGCLSNSD